VGEEVFLKDSPTKGIVYFGTIGKLSLRCIGPYVIITRVGALAYWLQLPDLCQEYTQCFYLYIKKILERPLDD
jgi:hypothetical protein